MLHSVDENNEAADGAGEGILLHGRRAGVGSSVCHSQRSYLSFALVFRICLVIWDVQSGETLSMHTYASRQSMGDKSDCDLMTLG